MLIKVLVVKSVMTVKKILADLEQKEEFQAWKTQHPADILAHVFFEAGNNQVGYYNAAAGTMTTFVLGATFQIIPDQEILRGDGDLEALDPSQVSIDVEPATETAQSTMKEHYGEQQLLKTLIILQHMAGKTLYNITFFTRSLKTVNVKVDAASGEVINHTQASLVSKM
jgi:hypothetical protein